MKRLRFLFFVFIFFASCGANESNTPQEGFADKSPNKHITNTKKFLFDNTKAETAGNADWVIDEDNNLAKRLPTPSQENIIATTPETFWTGALSSWGIALVKQQQHVETLQENGYITYGDANNAQDLSHYNVFVVDEPNIRF